MKMPVGFVTEENTKFQVDACENKSAIFPIQVHERAGFLPQVP